MVFALLFCLSVVGLKYVKPHDAAHDAQCKDKKRHDTSLSAVIRSDDAMQLEVQTKLGNR